MARAGQWVDTSFSSHYYSFAKSGWERRPGKVRGLCSAFRHLGFGVPCWCGVGGRGVRVYPYPWVYPTRTRGYGLGRVDFSRVESGTCMTSTGTGIPGFTRKDHDFFTILEREPFDFCMLSKLLMMKQLQLARENSILLGAYNRLLTYFLALLCWL